MLSLGLELGLPLSCWLYDLGNDCKGPRSIGQTFSRFSRGGTLPGLHELNIQPKTVEEVVPTYIGTRASGPRGFGSRSLRMA